MIYLSADISEDPYLPKEDKELAEVRHRITLIIVLGMIALA